MATAKQELGELGERLVAQHCACPKCKQRRTLKRLTTNFKCADIICDFCGLSRAGEASTSKDGRRRRTAVGAAWGRSGKRMDAGIYFPLFLVLVTPSRTVSRSTIFGDLQSKDLFKERAPLSVSAKRAGWQGSTTIWRRRAASDLRQRGPHSGKRPTSGAGDEPVDDVRIRRRD